jgi:hypothetical protein
LTPPYFSDRLSKAQDESAVAHRLEEQMEADMEQAAAAVEGLLVDEAATAKAQERALEEERAACAKQLRDAALRAREREEAIKASAHRQFGEMKARFMQDIDAASKAHVSDLLQGAIWVI